MLDWAVILQMPKHWCCLIAIMRMNQLRRTTRGWGKQKQDRRNSIWRPTHHSHAVQRNNPGEFQEQQSPRQHPVWLSELIPYRVTGSSLTILTVSSPMIRRTSRCVAICWRPQLAVQKRLGLFVTTLTCSSCSSTGHEGRLSQEEHPNGEMGRHGAWHTRNSGQVGRTCGQQLGMHPSQAVTPSPILTARARSSLRKYWWTMT